jgi:alkylhydroperoxidase/carboxymuconolactone decarboxylase family protein YurZ
VEGELATRLRRGRESYGRQFGVPPEEAEARLGELVGERMAGEAVLAAGGVWGSGPLATRDRSVAVVSALVALGGVGPRLRADLSLAVENGLTREDLEELLTLLAVYVGYARASVAMEELRAALAEPLAAPAPTQPPGPPPSQAPVG